MIEWHEHLLLWCEQEGTRILNHNYFWLVLSIHHKSMSKWNIITRTQKMLKPSTKLLLIFQMYLKPSTKCCVYVQTIRKTFLQSQCNAVLSYVSRCECIVYGPSVSRFVPPSQRNSGDSKTPGLAKLFTFPLFWCVYIYIYIFQFWYISKYKIYFLFYCFDVFTNLFTFPLFWYIYIYISKQ